MGDCPECGSDMQADRDRNGPYRKCQHCGHIEPPQPLPHGGGLVIRRTMHTPLPKRHFRDDLKTVAAFLIILAAFFAASIPYAIWGESGLS